MTAFVGDILSATAAPATGNPTPTRTWAWLRNNVAIVGQSASTYRVTEEDINTAVTSRQMETNFLTTANAVSNSLSVSGWSPSTLFATNEPGIWLDPSDVANLDWRRNLLTYSEQFDNAAWTKFGCSVTATNSVVAPDGSTSADTVTSSGTDPYVVQVANSTAITHTFSVWMQGVGSSIGKQPSLFIVRDSYAQALNSGPLAALTNQWQRYTFTGTFSASPTSQVQARVDFVDTSPASGNAVYIWGAQLELGSVATDYQRISDVNTEVLERFPKTTMYQDRAGSTAVTTPGQSVGLRLDKSKGLVLGSERIVNGDFSSGSTSWVVANADATHIATFSGGTLRYQSDTTSPQLVVEQLGALVVGRTYLVEVTTSSWTSGSVKSDSFGGNTVLGSGVGTTRFRVVASSPSFQITRNTSNVDITIDNISVKELPGNHAVANSDAARGIYGIEPVGGRRNLLTFTEQFSNASWSKTGVTVGASVTDPIGGTTAVALTSSISNSFFVQSPTSSANTAHTRSIWLKVPTGTASINMYANDNGTGFSVQSLSLTTSWQRFSLTATSSATATAVSLQIGGGNTWTSGQEIHVWGAQLETGSTATAYQRVTDQYNVTEAGKQTLHYVQYDGSDDGYVTPTITPGIDKVQVFAGVRKLGDPVGIIAELSPTVDTNNGSVILYSTSPSKWGFASRGTTLGIAEPGGYSPPLTSVLTGLGDISGDRATIRVNGTQITQTTSDQGTGNFLAYPIYIGRRGGTTFPFNGRDYGIITRFGANLSTSNINRAEYYMAQKTGVSL